MVVLLLCSWLFRCLPAAETLFCSSFFRTLLTGWRAAKFSAMAGQKTDYIDCKSKGKAMGMEDGRYGTFCVEDLGFLLRISVALG